MNSSFTAANRFQLAKPVLRTNGGISLPIATAADVQRERSWASSV